MADFLRSPSLADVPHGFSTRDGLEAGEILGGAWLALARQVHSSKVVIVHDRFDGRPEGDALVTTKPGILLGIVTADCAPVLLADPQAGVVGAAHAGWRGAFGGVLENTVDAMESLGADAARIRAVIGPTIAQESYEVDERFREQFADGDSRFFTFGRAGHRQFDLPAYVAARMERAGVEQIDDLCRDTYAEEARFFSYRRATHRGEDTGGRQLSVIGLALQS